MKKYRWHRKEPDRYEDGEYWDKGWMVSAIKWRLRWKDTIEGLYWDDPLVSSAGIAFHLFVHKDTPDEVIDRALIRAYQQRDIVYHRVWQIPVEWVAEAKWSGVAKEAVTADT